MVDDDDLYFNVAGVCSTWAESHETIPGGCDLSSQWAASRISRTLEDIEEHGVGSEEDVTGVDVNFGFVLRLLRCKINLNYVYKSYLTYLHMEKVILAILRNTIVLNGLQSISIDIM